MRFFILPITPHSPLQEMHNTLQAYTVIFFQKWAYSHTERRLTTTTTTAQTNTHQCLHQYIYTVNDSLKTCYLRADLKDARLLDDPTW